MLCCLKPILIGEFQSAALQAFFPEKTHLPQTVGGTAVTNLACARLSRGLPTDVITLDPKATEAIERYRSDLVTVWIIKRRENGCVRDGYRQERKLIEQALGESDADVCHAHWTYEYGLSAVLQKVKPYVVTVHDHSQNILRWVGVPYLGQFLITQYVLRKAKRRLSAVSPYVSEYVSRVTKLDTPIIPNVLGEAIWKKNEESSTLAKDPSLPLVTIVTVADAGKLKNVKRAIQAFQLTRGNRLDLKYKLFGSGLGHTGEMARWARAKGLSQSVEFAGWMPYDQVLGEMRLAAAIVHPSLEESFGNPVAEAMAMGIPVIGAQEAGGVSWLLSDGCGWLVSGLSVDDLSLSLSDVLNLPQEAQRRCLRARLRIEKICDADKIIEQYEQIYRRVMV